MSKEINKCQQSQTRQNKNNQTKKQTQPNNLSNSPLTVTNASINKKNDETKHVVLNISENERILKDSNQQLVEQETKLLTSLEDAQNWTNLHLSFTPQLIQSWQKHNFTAEQTRDWINIHSPTDQSQAIQEPEFYVWLRDVKKVDSDWVLNHGNYQALKQEYQQSQQSAQILQNPYPPKTHN